MSCFRNNAASSSGHAEGKTLLVQGVGLPCPVRVGRQQSAGQFGGPSATNPLSVHACAHVQDLGGLTAAMFSIGSDRTTVNGLIVALQP